LIRQLAYPEPDDSSIEQEYLYIMIGSKNRMNRASIELFGLIMVGLIRIYFYFYIGLTFPVFAYD
jgi:hypothetical protein